MAFLRLQVGSMVVPACDDRSIVPDLALAATLGVVTTCLSPANSSSSHYTRLQATTDQPLPMFRPGMFRPDGGSQ